MSNEFIIGGIYIIKEEKGRGLTSKVFRVEDKNTKINYAAKIILKHNEFFDNEKEILESLQNKNIPNIIHFINSGIIEGESFKNKYLILEYAEKGDLYRFIRIPEMPLKEIHAKLFFKKILNSVQTLHNNGVYHRDLKTGNILLDNKFNPLICDFGFSTIDKNILKEPFGSHHYAAPEIFKKSYYAEKVDIFALGVIIFNLVTGGYGFEEAFDNDRNYIYIKNKKYKKFWNNISNVEISEEFKELYVKIVAYKYSERPTIEEILKDKWMEEINNKSEKEIEELESEIILDFLERENLRNQLIKRLLSQNLMTKLIKKLWEKAEVVQKI